MKRTSSLNYEEVFALRVLIQSIANGNKLSFSIDDKIIEIEETVDLKYLRPLLQYIINGANISIVDTIFLGKGTTI